MAEIFKGIRRHIHLIGIGGIGVSGIARLLLRQGIKVSGSDLKENSLTEELRRLGVKIFIGHNPTNILGAQLVIYSSAIREDNPEIVEAKRQGIPLMRRAEALAELMKEKTIIAVTGSHGKTTTASLISYLLLEAGFLPTLAVGGILRNIDTNAWWGDGKYFVAEADESDGSFLCYRPNYSVITNIDYEHLDYYKDFQNELEAFRKFISNTKRDGCVFGCADDKNLTDMLTNCRKRYVLFGFDSASHIYPRNVQLDALNSQFDCFYGNRFLARFNLSLAGLHNISNALSVVALGLELGIDIEVIKKTLINYRGTHRRMEVKLEDTRYMVIDDYAHHPTEIKATLSAIRNLKSKRIIAIFQPHRYSRTRLLLDEFSRSFQLADCVVITDIYSANETPIEGVSSKGIYERLKQEFPDKPIDFLSKENIVEYILKIIKPNDLVITLGAGDITKICDGLVERLKGKDKV
ncbi:MAG: UDP-N-acetylmuramate--L-alanine ligase [Candidatus Omnitrophica bacterium]|nr:UDP-N-acetylmuramate--L-alanine ligase [Candidatus Omnitrophota bacterium]